MIEGIIKMLLRNPSYIIYLSPETQTKVTEYLQLSQSSSRLDVNLLQAEVDVLTEIFNLNQIFLGYMV